MSEMEQVRQQDRTQVQDPVTGRFLPGRSGNPAGTMPRAERERRIRSKARALARDLGISWQHLGAVDRSLLEQSLLASVEARQGRRERPSADFSTLLPDGAP